MRLAPAVETVLVPATRAPIASASTGGLVVTLVSERRRLDLRTPKGHACNDGPPRADAARAVVFNSVSAQRVREIPRTEATTILIDSMVPGRYRVEVVAMGFQRETRRWTAIARRIDTLVVRLRRAPICLDPVPTRGIDHAPR